MRVTLGELSLPGQHSRRRTGKTGVRIPCREPADVTWALAVRALRLPDPWFLRHVPTVSDSQTTALSLVVRARPRRRVLASSEPVRPSWARSLGRRRTGATAAPTERPAARRS